MVIRIYIEGGELAGMEKEELFPAIHLAEKVMGFIVVRLREHAFHSHPERVVLHFAPPHILLPSIHPIPIEFLVICNDLRPNSYKKVIKTKVQLFSNNKKLPSVSVCCR